MTEPHKQDLIQCMMKRGNIAISQFLNVDPEDVPKKDLLEAIKRRMNGMTEDLLNYYYATFCNGTWVVVEVCDQNKYTESHYFESAAPSKTLIASFDSASEAEEYRDWLRANAEPYTEDPPAGWEDENDDEKYDPRSWEIEFIPSFMFSSKTKANFPAQPTSIAALELTPRVYRLLLRAGLKTVEDVMKQADQGRLLEIRNCGRQAASEICQKLLGATGNDYFKRNRLKR